MDESDSEHSEDNTGDKLEEEAVEPHVEAEQKVTSIKVGNLIIHNCFQQRKGVKKN